MAFGEIKELIEFIRIGKQKQKRWLFNILPEKYL